MDVPFVVVEYVEARSLIVAIFEYRFVDEPLVARKLVVLKLVDVPYVVKRFVEVTLVDVTFEKFALTP